MLFSPEGECGAKKSRIALAHAPGVKHCSLSTSSMDATFSLSFSNDFKECVFPDPLSP